LKAYKEILRSIYKSYKDSSAKRSLWLTNLGGGKQLKDTNLGIGGQGRLKANF